MTPPAGPGPNNNFLLQVRRLRTLFPSPGGVVSAVDDVTFEVREGETFGLVGESGCGKTTAGMSILRLVDHPGRIVGGEVLFQGVNLLDVPLAQMRKVRGREIAMIFQDPLSALDPTMRVGPQMIEGIREHFGDSREQAWQKGIELLGRVGLAETHMRAYPHQLSGGMCQRVSIAMALSCLPRLLIADEPTTALDAATEAQILKLLKELKNERGLTLLIISHDFGVLVEMADRVGVMYAGQIVESGPAERILQHPSHPYAQRLLASVRSLHAGTPRELLPVVQGAVPDLARLPAGCRFHPRCPEVEPECRNHQPELLALRDHGSQRVRCLLRETKGSS